MCKPESYAKLFPDGTTLDPDAAKDFLEQRVSKLENPNLPDQFYAQSNYQPKGCDPIKAALTTVLPDNANLLTNFLRFDGQARPDEETYRIAEKQTVYFVDNSFFASNRFRKMSFGDTEPHRIRVVVGLKIVANADGKTFDVPNLPAPGVLPRGAILMLDASGLSGEQVAGTGPTLADLWAQRGVRVALRTGVADEPGRLSRVTSGGGYSLVYDPQSIANVPGIMAIGATRSSRRWPRSSQAPTLPSCPRTTTPQQRRSDG